MACENFMQNELMDHWLSLKRKWDKHFVPEDRLVWLDIKRLNLLGWSKQAFRMIVAKWGTVAHMEDNLGVDLYKNRMFLLY